MYKNRVIYTPLHWLLRGLICSIVFSFYKYPIYGWSNDIENTTPFMVMEISKNGLDLVYRPFMLRLRTASVGNSLWRHLQCT